MIKIKYDLKSYKIIKVILAISGCMLALALLLISTEIQGTEVLSLLLLYIGGGLFIYCLLESLSAFCYFKRLKVYGYTVPEDKNDYAGFLQNLPRNPDNQACSVYSKFNKIAIIVCFIMLGICSILDFSFFIKWHFMDGNCMFLFMVTLVFYLIVWLILVLIMHKQSNADKYRDDVEIDTGRKTRWTPGLIAANVIILFVICLIANSIATSMIKYVFESQIQADKDKLCNIRNAIEASITMYSDSDITNMKAYKDLQDGIDIREWENPDGDLEIDIADRLGINSFDELRDDFYMSKDAGVYVRIIDRKLTLELLNTVKEISLKI